MIVYRLDWQHHDHGDIVEWYGTKREAHSRAAVVRQDPKCEQVYGVKRETVPRAKARLLHWLNLHLNRDNG